LLNFTVQIPQDANYTSHPRNSCSSTIHKAARFRHCYIIIVYNIQLSMKCWCQLERAHVADHITAVTSVMELDSVTHLFTLQFHRLPRNSYLESV